jgi:hypothetical protein
MISDVFLTGRVGQKIDDDLRYVELDRPVPYNRQFVCDHIPVSYWSHQPNSIFMKLVDGALITLRGRLEINEKVGIIIVAEQFETLSSNPKTNLNRG